MPGTNILHFLVLWGCLCFVTDLSQGTTVMTTRPMRTTTRPPTFRTTRTTTFRPSTTRPTTRPPTTRPPTGSTTRPPGSSTTSPPNFQTSTTPFTPPSTVSTISPPTSPTCFFEYLRDPYKGFISGQRNSARTVTECKYQCDLRTNCIGFDFKDASLQCDLHMNSFGTSYQSTAVNTYQRFYPTCLGNRISECREGYTITANRQCPVGGRVYQSGVTTVATCRQQCNSKSDCAGFEFHTNTNFNCYHHRSYSVSSGCSFSSGVYHYFKGGSACIASSTVPTSTPSTLAPDQDLSFTFTLDNDYQATVKSKAQFESKLKNDIANSLGISPSRVEVSVSEGDKPSTSQNTVTGGSIKVEGTIKAGDPRADDLMKVLKNRFETSTYQFTSPENVQLINDRDSFRSGPVKDTTSDDDKLLGLPESYWILIGMGAVAFILVIIAISAICCTKKKKVPTATLR